MNRPISLGTPGLPEAPSVLEPRRPTRQIAVGKTGVGSDVPVSRQSMTAAPTAGINATLQQVSELTAADRDVVRAASETKGQIFFGGEGIVSGAATVSVS